MAFAQFKVTGADLKPYTPENLISNVFLGEGVEVKSITYRGVPQAVGYFTGGQAAIGIERGIVMTTGNASDAGSVNGPNRGTGAGDQISVNNASTATDPSLAAAATGPLLNAAVYEIRFVPSADTLRFRYCFASEEYPEFGCSSFNDVFGFFIQGPGFAQPTNIALIPGSGQVVSVRNIHPFEANPNGGGAACQPANQQYYNTTPAGRTFGYDGYTSVFTALAIVRPCQEYTIKLTISDVQDNRYDSGVFLEAKSFGTNALRVSAVFVSPDSSIAEGCTPGTIRFRSSARLTQDLPITYTLRGTATNGTDYTRIPATLSIPAGQQEVTIPLAAIEDNTPDDQETILLEYQASNCLKDTLTIVIRDRKLLPPRLPLDTFFCNSPAMFNLNGTTANILPTVRTFSNMQDVQFPVTRTDRDIESRITVSGIDPSYITPNSIRSVCVNIAHARAGEVSFYLVSPGGQIIELSSRNGGNGDNFTNTCFTPKATRRINAAGSLPPYNGTWLPEGPWSDLWDRLSPANGVWKLIVADEVANDIFNTEAWYGTLRDWSITFEPLYNVKYQWSPATGLNCDTCSTVTARPTQTTTYTLRATDTYGCSASDTITLASRAALAAPRVTCGPRSENAVTFIWPRLTGALGYEVNVNNGGWVRIPDTVAYRVNNLTPNVTVNAQVRGRNGCTAAIATAACTTCPEVPGVTVAARPASCASTRDGSVTLTPDGKKPPYTFQLGTATNGTGIFSALAPGAYTATVTDNVGCAAFTPVVITSPDSIRPDITVAQAVTCFNGANGSLRVNTRGGTAPLTYEWSDSRRQTTATATGLAPGRYTVTVRDANRCSETDTLTLRQPAALLTSVTNVGLKCAEGADASATVTASGGTGPYRYRWNDLLRSTLPTINGLRAQTYRVTVTDANNCTAVDSTEIVPPDGPFIVATSATTSCYGSLDGSINVDVIGDQPPYTFRWNTGQRTPIIGNLAAGRYTVTITDSVGCVSAPVLVDVDRPDSLLITLLPASATCADRNDGKVTLTVVGGAMPYTYNWSTGESFRDINNKTPGAYTVTVTDGNGCSNTRLANIASPDTLKVVAKASEVRCFGEKNGRLEATITGGNAPYTTLWRGPNGFTATVLKLDSLFGGTYFAAITDGKGCQRTDSVVVKQPTSELTLRIPVPADTICFNATDGRAPSFVTGGTTPYTYKWADGQTVAAAIGLKSSFYYLTITDARGCSDNDSTFVVQKATIFPYPEAQSPTCHNGSDGTATVAAIFYGLDRTKLETFQYEWSTTPKQFNVTASNLGAGVKYTVTATDADGCTGVQSIFTGNPEPMDIKIDSSQNARCFGDTNGFARANGLGGAGPYTYFWDAKARSQTTRVATGLTAGLYKVTATDSKGCFVVGEARIAQPALLVSRLSPQNALCFGESSGSAKAQPTGGLSPYRYQWSTGGRTAEVKDLAAGTYQVTITDNAGCTMQDTVVVRQPASALGGTATPRDVGCNGAFNGQITITGTGGTPPYRYALDDKEWNGSSRQIGLRAGSYRPRIIDRNGCTARLSPVVVNQRVPLVVDLGPDQTIELGESASIETKVKNSTGPFKYTWSIADSAYLSCMNCPNPTVDSLLFQRGFTVTVADSLGCLGEDRVVINITKPRRIFVPTGFSPNEDGQNDLLLVHGQRSAKILQFRVFDRWGELLYEASNFKVNDDRTGWDGKFRGKEALPGTYAWTLEVEYLDGFKERLQGDTTLLR